jgi:hypothetical protein
MVNASIWVEVFIYQNYGTFRRNKKSDRGNLSLKKSTHHSMKMMGFSPPGLGGYAH